MRSNRVVMLVLVIALVMIGGTVNAAPAAFDLLTPPDDAFLTDTPAALDITWEEAVGATGYTFDLDRPTGANVTLAGLTPAVDADPFACDAGTCTLSVADTSSILNENGFYSWTVVATDGAEDTAATNNPFTFTIADADFAPAGFELLGPADDAFITDTPAALDITWTEAAGAATYTFDLDRPTGANVTLSGLTPGVDGDPFACDAGTCTLSVADTSTILNENGGYSWIVTATNATGDTPASNNPFTFTIADADFAPAAFDLLTPPDAAVVTEVPASLDITWTEAFGAATYTFELDRPVAETVTLAGLTPAVDADPFVCDAGTCTLTVADPASILVDQGEYSWIVTATNATGDTPASNNPFTFTVATVLPAAFELLGPADDAFITDTPAALDITWTEAVGADTYTFDLDRPTGANVTLAGLTPAVDADPFACDAGTCTLSVADTSSILNENGGYSWIVTATNAAGDTPASNNPFTFTIADADFVPAGFELLGPADDVVLTEVPASLSITWTEAIGAATYTFELDRPVAETVTLAGLTPAADADPFVCEAGTCTLTVADPASILVDQGEYSWIVTATNAAGNTPASNNPFTFTVQLPLTLGAFNLLAPANNALVRDPAGVTAITWETSTGAANYNFILFKLSNNTRIGEVADLIVDSSICVDGVCTLTVPAELQAALDNGLYSWTVIASADESTLEAANGAYFFTVNTGTLELVSNGGFEAKDAGGAADIAPWTGKNLTKDRIKCNTSEKTVAYAGECAFQFRGSTGERSQLQQKLDITQVFQGEFMTVNAYINTKLAAAGKVVIVKIKYNETDAGANSDGSDRIELELTAPTTDETYQAFGGQLQIDGTVKNVKIQLRNRNASGKIFIDDVQVQMSPAAGRAVIGSRADLNVIPLP